MDFPEIRLGSEQLRVLAHPLRAQLLSALRMDGPTTATRLAERLGTNTGATSYHLRQLAAVGLVLEEDRPGSGRQRWWRAAQASHGFRRSEFDAPDDRAAVGWLEGHYLRTLTEQVETWLTERDTWPQEWQDAAESSDFMLDLTPDQLRELNAELREVILRYDRDKREGAEQVIVTFNSFPRRTR